VRALILARLRHRLGFALALGLLVIVAVWATMEGGFSAPSDGEGFVIEAGLMFAAGFVMAFHAFAFGRKTYGYLVHRSTGHRSAFWAILIADCGVLLASQWLFLAAHALWTATTPERAVALWGNYLTLGFAALGVCCGHALGSVAGLLRQRRVFSLSGLILMLFGGVISASFVLMHVIDIPLPPWILWLACVGLSTALLARLGLAMFVDGVADDRPHHMPLRLALAALGLVCVAPVFFVGVNEIQRDRIREVSEALPAIVASSSSQLEVGPRVRMFRFAPDGSEKLYQPSDGAWSIGTSHGIAATGEPRTPQRGWYESWESIRLAGLTDSMFEDGGRLYEAKLWWNEARHVLCIVRPHAADPEANPRQYRVVSVDEPLGAYRPRSEFLRNDAGAWPSSSAFVYRFPSVTSWTEPDAGILGHSLVVDPQARSILGWNDSLAYPRLTPKYFGARTTYDSLEVVIRRGAPQDIRSAIRRIAVKCGDKLYVCKNGRFERFQPEAGEMLESELMQASAYRVDVIRADALEPRVAIRSRADDRVLFEHQYEAERDFDFVVAHLASLARAPLFSVAAFLSDAPEQGRGSPAWADPLLRGGRRAWLLALNLAVAAGLALMTWRSLPHPRARAARIAWTVATLLLGFPAFMARLVVEPVLNREVRIEHRRAPAALILRTP